MSERTDRLVEAVIAWAETPLDNDQEEWMNWHTCWERADESERRSALVRVALRTRREAVTS